MHEERLQLQDQQEREEFDTITADLHHLKSTAVTPGVYNSPYVQPITAFGAPIEDHLSSTFRKSKYCHRHLKRALGREVYSRTYQRFSQTDPQSSSSSNKYQHSSAPRALDTYKLKPLYEETKSA
eukprot:TRINITY_DN8730_c0_g1_i2.p1 TRINITY_DN8730_c0_g1~~TRINITY_DN8730_c0_g1_i2.p1  ORF type:complete len:125 (+),score=10.77 TRINITY_DN8730_c0_g1_i2:172-546(+)